MECGSPCCQIRRKFRCCDANFSRRMRSVVDDLEVDDRQKQILWTHYHKIYVCEQNGLYSPKHNAFLNH